MIKVCLASDFDWGARHAIDLPPRTIFEFAGKLCGDLYQPTDALADPELLQCYRTPDERYDSEYKHGYLMTTGSAVLTKQTPCVTVHARMFIFLPDSPRYARSSSHEAWMAWRVLGFSVWHDDFGTPEGQPNGLGPIFDDFQIRAQIISDVSDPFVMAEGEFTALQNQIDEQNKRDQFNQHAAGH